MQRVLLLEDHPRLAALIRQAISQAGIACDWVERVEHAWTALQGQDYSAVLIDRGLPDGDGLSLVTRLRKAGQHVPCLLLTARDALHDRVEGLESGADDYLCKPFSMEELVARTRALLRRPPAQAALVPEFGDVSLHPEQSLMICASRSATLPRTELQIMLSLIKAKGAAVRRQTLEAAAWGQQEAVTPNALDVAVHRLRRRLEALGSAVRIVNQRAVGYAVTY
ncbi:response regulator transcription factor [Viridibacterium curvum]|uniref:Response regulator transcription factor n=1 Tax=Viridibacterium curvum TaxID=1101404 RepID=A0ABP9QJI8_9RHOO